MTKKNVSVRSKTIEQVRAATLADLKRIADKAGATASASQHRLSFPSSLSLLPPLNSPIDTAKADMGLDYKAMEQEDNAMIAVIEASARYKAPARYDDEIIVRTSLAGARGPVVRFRYSVVRAASEKADELLLCEGETTHIVVDRNMKKREMPENYTEVFRSILHPAS